MDKLGELEHRMSVVESTTPCPQLGSMHSTGNVTFGEEEILSDLHAEILSDESRFTAVARSIAEEFLNQELSLGSQRVSEVARRTSSRFTRK